MKSWCPSCALAAASSTLRVAAGVAGRAAMNLSRSCTLPKFERGAANALAICTAPIFQQRGSASRRTARARVDWTAEWSMQPLRRFRILGSRAGSKAFARGRKRPGTEPAALVHCVPAALDPTNVGLHVVDVVRNEIIHRDHLHLPEIRGQLVYRDDKTDRNGSRDLVLVHQGTRCMGHRASAGLRFRVLKGGRVQMTPSVHDVDARLRGRVLHVMS